MTKEEIAWKFAEKIESERMKLGYTQARMAKELQVSLSTYKNIISGVSQNIPIYVAYQVYRLTGDYYFEICDENNTPDFEFLIGFKNLPKWRKNVIRTFAAIEVQLAEKENCPMETEQEEYVTVYTLTGNMEDGMYYDSAEIKRVPMGRYQKICHGQIDCGIQITNNSFYPVYSKDDIILICQKAPREGDTGVFINKNTKCLHIRRFHQSDKLHLEPLASNGVEIILDNRNNEYLNEWLFFGYVLMKMR